MPIQTVVEACVGLSPEEIEDQLLASAMADEVADPQGVARYLSALADDVPTDELPGIPPVVESGNEGGAIIETVE